MRDYVHIGLAAFLLAAPIGAQAQTAATPAKAAPQADPGKYHNLKGGGIALHGYDAVAYVNQKQAVKGSPAFTATYDGVRYQFASAQSKAAFEADPARYVPQYGGFCAYGVARGFKVDVDPEAFSVVDGKLYLNVSKSVRETWSKDPQGYIRKANDKWPSVRDKKSGVLGGLLG
jgi:YHS domain-containing protein